MKLSLYWLRSMVDAGLSTEELAHRLTMSGIEIEAIEPVAPAFENVVVAQVVSVEKHPDADRLNLCQVDVGGERLQIVCGAANVAAGIKVPCARVGAVLPKIAIKEAKVRGIMSYGMLCSESELGLAAESSGLLVLPADAPVGANFRDYYELDDTLLTLKLTPNRADCLSVLGVAREIAATSGAALRFSSVQESAASTDARLAVRVAEPGACPLYCGRMVQGVDLTRPTPAWIERRLARSGLRCKNAVVDVTNYVMLEMGQPLHAFDADRLSGGIQVRYAKPGERVHLLNEMEVGLDPEMLVISDDRSVLALAGIMGGSESAVSSQTRDIFLEAAFFEPKAISGKSRRLGVSTDSSYRFERGVDFGSTRAAIERATQLILEICGGAAGEVVEIRGELPARNPIELRASRARRVLGIDLDSNLIGQLLGRLEIEFSESDGVFRVTPPSYRFDLKIEADLIEELARLYGYDNIPAVTPAAPLSLLPRPEDCRKPSQLRALLAGRDYQEIISYAFVDESWEVDFCENAEPIRLMNPIASQMGTMRTSLLGGLVDCLRFNLNRKQSRIRIFELGSCFFRTGDGFGQSDKVSGLAYGDADSEQWGGQSRPVDFYDVKADIEALFAPQAVRFEAAAHPALHPGRCAKLLIDGNTVGIVGEMHPKWLQRYDLPKAPLLFEIDLPALLSRRIPAYVEVSRFPPVRRDLALVVDERVEAQRILDVCGESLPAGIAEAALFDVYRGAGVPEGKKSLAFRIVLHDTQKTLLDAEVDAIMAQLVEALEKRFDSKLRI